MPIELIQYEIQEDAPVKVVDGSMEHIGMWVNVGSAAPDDQEDSNEFSLHKKWAAETAIEFQKERPKSKFRVIAVYREIIFEI